MRTLIVTAVEAEAAAVRAGLLAAGRDDADVHAVGVGIAAAAAGTAVLLAARSHELARRGYELVVSAGIAGGFRGRAEIGEVVVASESIAPELGADSPEGFVPIEELGFGTSRLPAVPFGFSPVVTGSVLTVQTVTGTAASTEALMLRYPDAVAEGMEGFGVATAASRAGVPFAEVRTISNLVGPRDKSAWFIKEALAALTTVFAEATP